MEDVLEVYTRPHDPRRPQVCLDETSRRTTALLASVTVLLPVGVVDLIRSGVGACGHDRRLIWNGLSRRGSAWSMAWFHDRWEPPR